MAADHAGRHRLAHPFLDRRYERRGYRAALDLVDELEAFGACAARQRLDAQEDFAELAGATCLLLVPMVAFGRRSDRFAVGDARRARLDLAPMQIGEPLEQGAQVQLAEAVDHGLVGGDDMLHPQARIFIDELLQDVPEPLLVAAPLRLDRDAVHRHRKVERLQVDVVVFGGVVQHAVELHFVDLRHRADVTRPGARNLHVLLALQQQQVTDLEGLPAVADVELAVARDGSLVDAEDPHLAHVRILRHLEHMGEHVAARVGLGAQRLRRITLAAQELRRIAFARVRQQPHDRVEQFGDTGTVTGADEADRNQVPFAQRLLQRRVQFARIDVALVQVALDEIGIDLDHLLDERAMRLLDAGKVGLLARRRGRVEEAIDDARAAVGRQIQRQTLATERRLDLRQQAGQVDALRVDLADEDHARQAALLRPVHHARAHHFDARRGVDDDRRGLYRLERRHRLAEEVGVAGGIDQVHADTVVQQVHHRGIERMLHSSLHRVEVADRRATLETAGRADHAGFAQQRLGKAGLSGSRLADEGQRADRRDVERGGRRGQVTLLSAGRTPAARDLFARA